jgi:hypothetical protein
MGGPLGNLLGRAIEQALERYHQHDMMPPGRSSEQANRSA